MTDPRIIKCPECGKSIEVFKQRSEPENRYYWGVVVTILRNELGEHSKYVVHEMLKSMFLKEIHHIETVHGVKEIEAPKSTTELSTAEFEDYLTSIRQWASMELGIFIPEPNEIA